MNIEITHTAKKLICAQASNIVNTAGWQAGTQYVGTSWSMTLAGHPALVHMSAGWTNSVCHFAPTGTIALTDDSQLPIVEAAIGKAAELDAQQRHLRLVAMGEQLPRHLLVNSLRPLMIGFGAYNLIQCHRDDAAPDAELAAWWQGLGKERRAIQRKRGANSPWAIARLDSLLESHK